MDEQQERTIQLYVQKVAAPLSYLQKDVQELRKSHNQLVTTVSKVDRMAEDIKDIKSHLEKLNGRTRKLENDNSFMRGAVALAVALGIPNIIRFFT